MCHYGNPHCANPSDGAHDCPTPPAPREAVAHLTATVQALHGAAPLLVSDGRLQWLETITRAGNELSVAAARDLLADLRRLRQEIVQRDHVIAQQAEQLRDSQDALHHEIDHPLPALRVGSAPPEEDDATDEDEEGHADDATDEDEEDEGLCAVCNGTGESYDGRGGCGSCRGTGVVREGVGSW